MGGIERFILENIDTLIVLAFIVLPIVLNLKKLKKKVMKQPPGVAPDAEQKKKMGASLEGKVRRFFDELVEQQKPKKPELSTLEEPVPEPRLQRSMQLEPDDEILEVSSPNIPLEEVEAPLPQPEAPVVTKAISARELRKMEGGIEALALPMAAAKTTKQNAYIGSLRNYSRHDLRKAIVLMEVFGKPAAMKR